MEDVASSWRRVASTHNLKDLLRQPAALTDKVDPKIKKRKMQVLGLFFVVMAAVGLTSAAVALPALKFMPRSQANPWLATIQDDWYYCLLIPLMLPVTAAAVFLNWFSLKLFKHNS